VAAAATLALCCQLLCWQSTRKQLQSCTHNAPAELAALAVQLLRASTVKQAGLQAAAGATAVKFTGSDKAQACI
jgi:hypothetical protein